MTKGIGKTSGFAALLALVLGIAISPAVVQASPSEAVTSQIAGGDQPEQPNPTAAAQSDSGDLCLPHWAGLGAHFDRWIEAWTGVEWCRSSTPEREPTASESESEPAESETEATLAPEPVPTPAPEAAPAPTPAPAPEPQPTPTPTPTPNPSANLLFKATHIEEFWLNQSAPGAVTEVPDPAGSGESVFQMTVGDKDVYPITPTENPRAELVSTPTINPGDELWWSSKFYLPSSFPSSIPSWLTLMEGPYGSPFNGTPPWHIEVSGEHIQWSRNGTYNWDVPWQMPLVKNSWVSVMVHEKFASEGWVEMWIDGKPIDFFSASTYNPNHVAPTQRLKMQTMDASNDTGPNAIHLMNYRKVGMFNSVTLDEGPLAIGTTQESVEG